MLTPACGKYRFNDLELGEIGGLPRLLDMGQCNDAYSAIQVAVALAGAFTCGINDLPLSLVLSWYEQKAVCILLTLLSPGIGNIYPGPTLPAFLSENVLKLLVDKFNIKPITTPEAGLKAILGQVQSNRHNSERSGIISLLFLHSREYKNAGENRPGTVYFRRPKSIIQLVFRRGDVYV